MITIYVKHYLTSEGLVYAKNTWIPNVHRIMSIQPGFIAFKHEPNYDEDDCINVTVQFVDEAAIQAWIDYPDHDSLVNDLDRFRSRHYWQSARTENETIERDHLEWIDIKPVSLTLNK